MRALRIAGACRSALLAVIWGLVTYAAFPPMGLWWAGLIGVGGLMLLTRGAGLRAGLGLGALYGAGLLAPLLHFTAVAMGNPIGWAALTVFQSLYLALLGGAWALVSRLPALTGAPAPGARRPGRRAARRWLPPAAARIGAFAILWAGIEELRSSWPLGGFPFGRLAFAMADAPMLPVAAYGGSLALSLVAALIAACLAEAVAALLPAVLRLGPRPARAGTIGTRRPSVAALAAGAAAALMMAPAALPLATGAQEGTIRVGAVQGNVAKDFEDAFNRALEVTGNHATATEQLAADVGPGTLDMVIWPENAADLDPRSHASTAALLDRSARAVGAPVLVGAVPVEGRVRYNDMLLWSPQEGPGAYYRKHRPVPFAEYIPARSLVRRLTSQVDRISVDMAAGTGPSALTVPAATQGRQVPLAMGICFEVAYDDSLREGVLQGGRAIVIPTNNASFLDSGEAAQQLAQGRVQAVVHGRSLVQVSTVGYTAIIAPDGSVEQVTQPYTQASLVADVALRTSLTPADRLGAWPGAAAESLAAILALAGIVNAVRTARRRP
ncbi:apolipoprotein N-acyltransferase [Actinomyces bowdenii]|uniref:Apolipoprotein N-acyltransferase n=1 Tax=Actinomyces bowdenii TaxID=131109 RepID=A0A3P1UZI5_9ACTO|nr:apolipoprotein N-acyltransferase [Actinomyces bowdenii]RRD27242.1 apolipoprotein N-acyltransferase [Actinomyces bowdenii]